MRISNEITHGRFGQNFRIYGLLIGLIFISSLSSAQGIEVDNTSYTSQALTEMLLNDACVEISNVSRSSSEAVAYFNSNGSDFPIEEGVVIRSGKAKYSEGIYTGENLSSQLNANSDPDLEEINNADGQPTNITDVAFLEFDIVPLSENFEFNFLFASNEYGEWQCLSSDVFAFLVTNLNTGETDNVAVIPGTSTSVSVKNIRDNTFNVGCNSQNPGYFDTYNVDNPQNSSVNMRGFTQVLTAKSNMIPGDTYRIRLVIGDSNDAEYDSAVFLEAGSFDASLDIGADKTICVGDEYHLSTGLSDTEYLHSWKKDGQLLVGENGSNFEVTEPGTYTVTVTKSGSNCELTDTIVFDELQVDSPQDIILCDSGMTEYTFDLTLNNADALGVNPQNYKVVFYTSISDAQNDIPIPENELDQYSSSGNETIYIRVFNTKTQNFCDAILSFDLLIDDPIIAEQPDNIYLCYVASGYNIDLTQVQGEVLAGQNPEDFEIEYYSSNPEIDFSANPINETDNFSLSAGFETQTIWVKVMDPDDSDCYTLVSFEIIEYPEVPVDGIENVIECEFFILPNIEDGNYFTDSGGEGTPLFPGDTISQQGTYYIFNEDETNHCLNESSFTVILLEEYDISGTYCGEFEIPTPPKGDFYTEPGGPEGEGNIVSPGTIIDESVDLYFYAEIDGEFCRDDLMEIIIHPLPVIDNPEDVVECYSYELPELIGGDYYTQPEGGGQLLSAGDQITASQKIYVFADDGTCTNQNSFRVYIITNFENIEACGSYILPEVEIGGYYTQPEGQGQQISEGTEITESQEVYYYASTTSTPNCTANMSFYITIKPIPEVDSLEDVKLCEGDSYTLPDLENGEYYTQAGRNGDVLEPGDTVGEDQEIYINNILNGCQNETSFTVEIFELPPISNFTDIYTCDPYVVPEPNNGEIFTEPGGQGSIVSPGEELYTTQTLYIYNRLEEEPFCENEDSFTVNVNYTYVEEIDDVAACDYYILPELDNGDYYTESGGEGDILQPGDTIVNPQTMYVYEEKGERFVCSDEESFVVSISETPELPDFESVTICGEYELPALNEEIYEDWDVAYYRESGGQNKINPEDYLLEPGEYQIYVYAYAVDNPNCFDEKQFDVSVNPLMKMEVEDAAICVDPETEVELTTVYLESGVNPDIYTIEWFLEDELVHTGENYEAVEVGLYTIIATKNGPNDGEDCDYEPFVVKVRAASKPIAQAYVITPDFSDNASIKIDIISGVGTFVYSLNDGPYQPENVFNDVESGIHTIKVKDLFGDCGITKLKVQVLKYPKFFTPNEDGVNDTWNIRDLMNNSEAIIYIFDRYGKLLTSIKPDGPGWDGTFKGKQMPSNDYWFKAVYKINGEERIYKANFTLKR